MKNNAKHIAISGNIGSGKTTLTEMLAKHYNWQPEYENVEGNPYLADFYENMYKWAFQLQVYFLNSRFEQMNKVKIGQKTVIQDRTIYEDAHIFAKSLYEQGFLKNRDYKTYRSLFDSMIQFVKPPNLLIYLKADIGKLMHNIEVRGRDYERAIRIDYLKDINANYEDWIKKYNGGRLLLIDVNDMDFVKNSEDFSEIVSKIDVELHGLFSNQDAIY